MMRRVVVATGVAAAVAMMACGADQSTNTTVTSLTAAQLALHFDTLAGQLPVGDPRLAWYQNIASVLARGVSPTAGQMHLGGGPAVLEMVAELDAFPDSEGGKLVADSTYRLTGWTPSTRPVQFLDVRVRFVPPKSGTTDTTTTYVTFYGDTTTKNIFTDSSEIVLPTVIGDRGLCQVTPLQNLTVPSNPCTKVAVDWLIGGGTDLLVINPLDQVSGTHLTQ